MLERDNGKCFFNGCYLSVRLTEAGKHPLLPKVIPDPARSISAARIPVRASQGRQEAHRTRCLTVADYKVPVSGETGGRRPPPSA